MDRESTPPESAEGILEEQTPWSLAQVSRACAVHAERILELVDEGVITPIGQEPHRWRFTFIHVRRARLALRLQHDLGVNLAGAALALQPMDEVETLRGRLEVIGGD